MAGDERAGRSVFVGDVHGCADELDELLGRLGFGDGDRLYLVGDLAVRGPHPQRVVELVGRLDARAVRGNHEARLLRYRQVSSAPGAELSPADRKLRGNRFLREAAAALDEASWTYLASLPLWLDVESHGVRLVHGGTVPGVEPGDHDERTLLCLRGIRDDGSPTIAREEGTPWGARYRGPPHVVHGHDAQAEPRLFTWTTGLDTGCVYGGALTALVLDAREPVPAVDARRDLLVTVKARRRYYPPD